MAILLVAAIITIVFLGGLVYVFRRGITESKSGKPKPMPKSKELSFEEKNLKVVKDQLPHLDDYMYKLAFGEYPNDISTGYSRKCVVPCFGIKVELIEILSEKIVDTFFVFEGDSEWKLEFEIEAAIKKINQDKLMGYTEYYHPNR